MFWFFGHEACGILAPRPGIEPASPALEGRLLTTGPPGKSRDFLKKSKKRDILKIFKGIILMKWFGVKGDKGTCISPIHWYLKHAPLK